MFEFFKRKKKTIHSCQLSDDEWFAEFKYRIEHDEEYKKSIERNDAFFKADRKAREEAGLTDKAGSYTFTCPNCGTLCRGGWVHNDVTGEIHGGTGCNVCNIHLRV